MTAAKIFNCKLMFNNHLPTDALAGDYISQNQKTPHFILFIIVGLIALAIDYLWTCKSIFVVCLLKIVM